jgi:hypothetical protein
LKPLLAGSGSEVAQRNAKAAEAVIGAVMQATGTDSPPDAVKAVQNDPVMAQQARAAAADTLDQFVAASEGWNEVGCVRECRVAGLRAVYFGEVQARKGDTRRELTVIDLGDVRVAVAADVSEWAE